MEHLVSPSVCFLCSFLSFWQLKDVRQGGVGGLVGSSRSLEKNRDPFLPLRESRERFDSQTGRDVELGKKKTMT